MDCVTAPWDAPDAPAGAPLLSIRPWASRRAPPASSWNIATARTRLRDCSFEALGGAAAFDEGGVLLGDLVHLAHRPGHLLDAAALLPARLAISVTSADSFWKLVTTLPSSGLASFSSFAPSSTFVHAVGDQRLDLAAAALRWSGLRTLARHHREATPCSPAALSTAALSARMLVWKAIEVDHPMMSRSSSSSPGSSPSCPAPGSHLAALLRHRVARAASSRAWRALSAFCRTVALSSSIEAGRLFEAARLLFGAPTRSGLPAAISWAAVLIDSDASFDLTHHLAGRSTVVFVSSFS